MSGPSQRKPSRARVHAEHIHVEKAVHEAEAYLAKKACRAEKDSLKPVIKELVKFAESTEYSIFRDKLFAVFAASVMLLSGAMGAYLAKDIHQKQVQKSRKAFIDNGEIYVRTTEGSHIQKYAFRDFQDSLLNQINQTQLTGKEIVAKDLHGHFAVTPSILHFSSRNLTEVLAKCPGTEDVLTDGRVTLAFYGGDALYLRLPTNETLKESFSLGMFMIDLQARGNLSGIMSLKNATTIGGETLNATGNITKVPLVELRIDTSNLTALNNALEKLSYPQALTMPSLGNLTPGQIAKDLKSALCVAELKKIPDAAGGNATNDFFIKYLNFQSAQLYEMHPYAVMEGRLMRGPDFWKVCLDKFDKGNFLNWSKNHGLDHAKNPYEISEGITQYQSEKYTYKVNVFDCQHFTGTFILALSALQEANSSAKNIAAAYVSGDYGEYLNNVGSEGHAFVYLYSASGNKVYITCIDPTHAAETPGIYSSLDALDNEHYVKYPVERVTNDTLQLVNEFEKEATIYQKLGLALDSALFLGATYALYRGLALQRIYLVQKRAKDYEEKYGNCRVYQVKERSGKKTIVMEVKSDAKIKESFDHIVRYKKQWTGWKFFDGRTYGVLMNRKRIKRMKKIAIKQLVHRGD